MPDTPIRDTVYFYKFNNYYNRIVKRYDTIEEYGDPMLTQANCNFVHGDGVNSSFTINKGLELLDTPDYCIVEDYNGNVSRWFVTNSFKNRSGQDELKLRRDLIADFYSDIVKFSPCLIRKGYVSQDNPLIFQDEGVAYNKVKQDEILIKDESNCSYIVGFISNTAYPSGATVNGTVKDYNYDYNYTTLADFPYKNYVQGAGNTHSSAARIMPSENSNLHYSLKFGIRAKNVSVYRDVEMVWNEQGLGKPTWYTPTYSNGSNGVYYQTSNSNTNVIIQCSTPVNDNSGNEIAYALSHYPSNLYNNVNSMQNSYAKDCFDLSEGVYTELQQFVGKKIKIGATVYNVSLASENSQNTTVVYNAYNPTINSAFNSIISFINSHRPSQAEMSYGVYTMNYYNSANRYQPSDLKIMANTIQYYLVLTEASSNISTNIDTPSNRTHLDTAPYDMFMLINESNIPYKVGTNNYISNHEVNMNIAQAICQNAGSGAFDIQLVPFNPMRGTILADGTLNFYNYDVHEIKNPNNDVIGHYLLCNSSDLKFTLEKNELKINPENYKKDYNLKLYRLCSPNQETAFDFSPSMNRGINTWEISCNYRPYASYIKVQPTWNWLYGIAEYNNKTDFRGLVYNSSLCVTQLNDAYATYINNNKNYQQLFDNQINTLTKQQNIQLSAMEETLGLRSFTGMPIGSILKVIGGSKDIDMQRELNNVALGKMQSDFNYQMDNIKSMPHTIKKLTAINEDTRIFPYIEIYSATAIEEQSFDYKMQYTGYTIMTTGKIWDYCEEGIETFVQADLIRLDLSRSEETADNHIAIEIAAELEKGLYITKESE